MSRELLSWPTQNPNLYTFVAETGGTPTLGISAHSSVPHCKVKQGKVEREQKH